MIIVNDQKSGTINVIEDTPENVKLLREVVAEREKQYVQLKKIQDEAQHPLLKGAEDTFSKFNSLTPERQEQVRQHVLQSAVRLKEWNKEQLSSDKWPATAKLTSLLEARSKMTEDVLIHVTGYIFISG